VRSGWSIRPKAIYLKKQPETAYFRIEQRDKKSLNLGSF